MPRIGVNRCSKGLTVSLGVGRVSRGKVQVYKGQPCCCM